MLLLANSLPTAPVSYAPPIWSLIEKPFYHEEHEVHEVIRKNQNKSKFFGVFLRVIRVVRGEYIVF